MDVTELAAPTTPLIIFRTAVLLQWYSAPSMLLIEPRENEQIYRLLKFRQHICAYTSNPGHARFRSSSSTDLLSFAFHGSLCEWARFDVCVMTRDMLLVYSRWTDIPVDTFPSIFTFYQCIEPVMIYGMPECKLVTSLLPWQKLQRDYPTIRRNMNTV